MMEEIDGLKLFHEKYNKLNYDKNKFVNCCPHCKSTEYIEIFNRKDGLFSIKQFSHYHCVKCQKIFKNSTYYITVPIEPIKDLIQLGLDSKITATQLINELRNYYIFCHNKR